MRFKEALNEKNDLEALITSILKKTKYVDKFDISVRFDEYINAIEFRMWEPNIERDFYIQFKAAVTPDKIRDDHDFKIIPVDKDVTHCRFAGGYSKKWEKNPEEGFKDALQYSELTNDLLRTYNHLISDLNKALMRNGYTLDIDYVFV